MGTFMLCIYIYNHPDVAGTMGLTTIMPPPLKKKKHDAEQTNVDNSYLETVVN